MQYIFQPFLTRSFRSSAREGWKIIHRQEKNCCRLLCRRCRHPFPTVELKFFISSKSSKLSDLSSQQHFLTRHPLSNLIPSKSSYCGVRDPARPLSCQDWLEDSLLAHRGESSSYLKTPCHSLHHDYSSTLKSDPAAFRASFHIHIKPVCGAAKQNITEQKDDLISRIICCC
jgi:hypothetical protein